MCNLFKDATCIVWLNIWTYENGQYLDSQVKELYASENGGGHKPATVLAKMVEALNL